MVKHLLSFYEALDLIPSTKEKRITTPGLEKNKAIVLNSKKKNPNSLNRFSSKNSNKELYPMLLKMFPFLMMNIDSMYVNLVLFTRHESFYHRVVLVVQYIFSVLHELIFFSLF